MAPGVSPGCYRPLAGRITATANERASLSPEPKRASFARIETDCQSRTGRPGRCGYARMRHAARSAIAYTVALVFAEMGEGMIEASATRSPLMPCTRRSVSTTASSSRPMRQVSAQC